MPALAQPPAPVGLPTPAELAGLLEAMTEATARLNRSHEALTNEVARLAGELDEAREQLERARRLSALGEMAAGIAHEVRNPLGSIALHARLLEQDLADRPAQCRIASRILVAVRGVEGVVGDVLEFARELHLAPAWCDATDLVDAALRACVVPQTIRVRTPGGGCVRAWCDAPSARRALVNVIRNAVEAMETLPAQEHELVLGASRRDGFDAAGRRASLVALSVADTGPGVEPDVLARMFNPFFTTRAAGTGLGLAIVHRIMDAHAGRVEVASAGRSARRPGARGRGTTFELLFPDPAPGRGDGERPGLSIRGEV